MGNIKTPPGRPTEYPWDYWFSQGEFTMSWVLYGSRLLLMAQQARNEAHKRGVGVSIRTQRNDLIVTIKALQQNSNQE